jgi:thiosulfate/3-mercaptopyruvate sulfurtransferase
MTGYAHPEALVSTPWVAEHLDDAAVKLLAFGWEPSEYDAGHIPGAVAGWTLADLQRLLREDAPNGAEIDEMLSKAGIAGDQTVVVYGGFGNLLAAMAFWVLRVHGHADLRMLDGGRQKWLAEGRPLTTERPAVVPTRYVARAPNPNLRADKDLIVGVLGRPDVTLVDARPVDMYAGDDDAGTKRGGRIPGAVNIAARAIVGADGEHRWQTPTTHDDGTFKSAEELRALFSAGGVSADRNVITYCLRGGLSSHMWFVLTQLLGYPNVREYDRSWVEWGNLADAPVER